VRGASDATPAQCAHRPRSVPTRIVRDALAQCIEPGRLPTISMIRPDGRPVSPAAR
jgi:hypothetical protein